MTSRKSPLELAALATAAVPGMRVTALRPPTYSDELSTVTGIEDAAGHRWIVTCPHEEVSGPALEATSGILDRLGQAHDHDYIPFDVPRLAGQTKLQRGGRGGPASCLGASAADSAQPTVMTHPFASCPGARRTGRILGCRGGVRAVGCGPEPRTRVGRRDKGPGRVTSAGLCPNR